MAVLSRKQNRHSKTKVEGLSNMEVLNNHVPLSSTKMVFWQHNLLDSTKFSESISTLRVKVRLILMRSEVFTFEEHSTWNTPHEPTLQISSANEVTATPSTHQSVLLHAREMGFSYCKSSILSAVNDMYFFNAAGL